MTPRADAVKAGRRAEAATRSAFARPRLVRRRARRHTGCSRAAPKCCSNQYARSRDL